MSTRAASDTAGVHGSRVWTGLVLVVAMLLVAPACQKPPPVVDMGGSAEAGGMAFSVLGYSVVRPEIATDEGVYEYAKPVLSVTVRAKNTGKDSFRYVPAHGGRQMTEASTPLLYYAPENNKKTLPPKKKSPLKGVVLEEGSLEGQLTTGKKLKPGDSVTDRYLFELPSEKSAELIFSVPPLMHRGDKPVLHRISYSYSKPEGPAVRQLGETVSLDGIAFTLDSAALEYIKLTGSGGKTGYSTNPLFKVGYTIKNTTDSAVTYRPGHRTTSGPRPPALYVKGEESKTIPRAKFSSELSPVDQVDGSRTIKSGKEIQDFAIFVKPDGEVTGLRFEYPAGRIGRTGLLRYQIPFKDQKPPEPPEKLKEQLDKQEGSGSEEG